MRVKLIKKAVKTIRKAGMRTATKAKKLGKTVVKKTSTAYGHALNAGYAKGGVRAYARAGLKGAKVGARKVAKRASKHVKKHKKAYAIGAGAATGGYLVGRRRRRR